MDKKQTAIEWLKEQYVTSYRLEETEFVEALSMEKEQLIKFVSDYLDWATDTDYVFGATEDYVEQFYNDTYGKNGTTTTD